MRADAPAQDRVAIVAQAATTATLKVTVRDKEEVRATQLHRRAAAGEC